MPTGTSWLNQAKRCCALSTEIELGRGIHHSTQELEQTIRCNDDPSNGSSPPPTFSPQSNTSGCAPSRAQHNRRNSPGIQKRHTKDEVDASADSAILSISSSTTSCFPILTYRSAILVQSTPYFLLPFGAGCRRRGWASARGSRTAWRLLALRVPAPPLVDQSHPKLDRKSFSAASATSSPPLLEGAGALGVYLRNSTLRRCTIRFRRASQNSRKPRRSSGRMRQSPNSCSRA